MKDPLEHLDQLSREALSGFEVPPPARVARKIHRSMFWWNLWQSATWRFSLIVLSAFIIGGLGWFVIPGLREENPAPAGQTGITTETESTGMNQAVTPLKIASAESKTGTGISNSMDAGHNAEPVAQPAKKAGQVNAQTEDVEEILVEDLPPEKLFNSAVSEEDLPVMNSETVLTEPAANEEKSWITRKPGPSPIPFKSFTDPEVGSLQKQNVRKFRSRPLFDLSLVVSPLSGNAGEKAGNTIRIKTHEPSGSVGLLVHYNLKRWFIETGIQYTTIQTVQSADLLLYNPRNIQQSWLTGQNTVVDTNSFWHYYYIQDSVIHTGDSVWVTMIDTTVTNVYTDTLLTVSDSMKNASWTCGVNIFEIPLGVGYKFYAGRFELQLKAGLLLGISSRTTGRTFLESSSAGLVPVSEVYTSKGIQASWVLSAAALLPVSEHWAVLLSPTYRSSFTGFKNSEGLPLRRYDAWGIGLGLRYEF